MVGYMEEIYKIITEIMYDQFSKGSSIEHCKGYILEDVLELFERKFPDLKRLAPQEYIKEHSLYMEKNIKENG